MDHPTIALDNGKEVKKAQGIKKYILNTLSYFEFKKRLDTDEILMKSMFIFKSIKHIILTQKITKIALNSNDDKRYANGKNAHTLAWGHYKIPK